MVVIRRVDAISVGRIVGMLYALLGLLAGAGISALALLGFMGATRGGSNGFESLIMGAGAIIILPLVYGVAGFIGGLLTGFLYNLCASLAGGIKFELQGSVLIPDAD